MVSKSYPMVFSKRYRLSVSGFMDTDKFRNYAGLDRFSAGMQAEFAFRSSGEFGSPTYGVFARLSADKFNSSLRDGSHSSVGVNLRKALSDRINLFSAFANNTRKGNSDVFNTNDQSLRMNLDYSLTMNQTFYLTGEYRKGDFVSSGQPTLTILDMSTVFVHDDAFDAQGLFDYRLKGKSAMLTLGYNLALGTKDSADFSWHRVESTPDSAQVSGSPMKYIDNQLSISYLMAF
jgi:hypothetical protein